MITSEQYARIEHLEQHPELLPQVEAQWESSRSETLQQSNAEIKASVVIKDEGPRRPTLNDAAMYGLAGKVVNTILPHSEADKVALLLHFLVGYGSVIGRSAYCQVESTRHYSNIFFGCVGETAKGRKGTAWNRVRDVLARIDHTWARERIQSGLSSGEGLIAAVADHDEIATDRRLFVLQPELASTLKVMARDGNTLSPLIREAWDCGSLRRYGAGLLADGGIRQDRRGRNQSREELSRRAHSRVRDSGGGYKAQRKEVG